jgi:putative methyltransferase (TIGR04325 family)
MLKSLYLFARSVSLYFRFPYACYRGVYESFAAAEVAAPRSKKLGYDHPDLAQEYRQDFSRYIGYYDYPVLLWLKKILQPQSQVFDFGGNIGTHFYGYERYLTYPEALTWLVCELPEIIKAGEALAQEEQRPELRFTQNLSAADGTDIFLASGSVQYVQDLSQELIALHNPPQHLLINRIPLCEGATFTTLQNGGLVSYPVQVSNREGFIQSLQAIGYELVDFWRNPAEPVAVPFHPEFNSLCFSGLYMRKLPQG